MNRKLYLNSIIPYKETSMHMCIYRANSIYNLKHFSAFMTSILQQQGWEVMDISHKHPFNCFPCSQPEKINLLPPYTSKLISGCIYIATVIISIY